MKKIIPLLSLVCSPSLALAASSSALFQKPTTKLQDIVSFLSGPFGIGLCTLAFLGAAIALLNAKLSKEKAYMVMGGAVLFGSAAQAANYFMN